VHDGSARAATARSKSGCPCGATHEGGRCPRRYIAIPVRIPAAIVRITETVADMLGFLVEFLADRVPRLDSGGGAGSDRLGRLAAVGKRAVVH